MVNIIICILNIIIFIVIKSIDIKNRRKLKKYILTIIIIIIVVNNIFKKNYCCINFGHTSLILLLIW